MNLLYSSQSSPHNEKKEEKKDNLYLLTDKPSSLSLIIMLEEEEIKVRSLQAALHQKKLEIREYCVKEMISKMITTYFNLNPPIYAIPLSESLVEQCPWLAEWINNTFPGVKLCCTDFKTIRKYCLQCAEGNLTPLFDSNEQEIIEVMIKFAIRVHNLYNANVVLMTQFTLKYPFVKSLFDEVE
jgi:hypothetical protein